MHANRYGLYIKNNQTMTKSILFLFFLINLNYYSKSQTITDFDGNVYHKVNIGTQTWLKENLNVTHFRNGSAIPLVTDDNQWKILTTGAYCNYNNDQNIANTYGRLYNWFVVDDAKNLCPIGWHVPTESDWIILINFLGGESIAGDKLKETGTTHWNQTNVTVTNESGFTALPAGYRMDIEGTFWDLETGANFWSSTEVHFGAANSFLLGNYSSSVYMEYDGKKDGFSVRCINDTTLSVNDINIENRIILFPNPTTENLIIECSDHLNYNLSIYNIIGDLILQTKFENGKYQINVCNFPKGVYLIKLTSANRTAQLKWTKN